MLVGEVAVGEVECDVMHTLEWQLPSKHETEIGRSIASLSVRKSVIPGH
jgi:hypothetical protein